MTTSPNQTKYHSELHTVLDWIKDERCYQTKKFDYSKDDIEHIQEGFGEDSWLYQQVMNYLGRVKYFGLDLPHGRQAYMKLITTLVGLAEAMVHVYGMPPAPGVSSGNIFEWDHTKRVYISGGMTGLPDKNRPMFDEYEAKLAEMGLHPVNPSRNEDIKSDGWEDYMKTDLGDLLSCRAIFMLPGWDKSKGATMEKELATELNMPVFEDLGEIESWMNSLASSDLESTS